MLKTLAKLQTKIEERIDLVRPINYMEISIHLSEEDWAIIHKFLTKLEIRPISESK